MYESPIWMVSDQVIHLGLELRLEERRQVTGFTKRWDSNALERGYCLVECYWIVLGRYLGTRLDGRLALQWWPRTRLTSSLLAMGRPSSPPGFVHGSAQSPRLSVSSSS